MPISRIGAYADDLALTMTNIIETLVQLAYLCIDVKAAANLDINFGKTVFVVLKSEKIESIRALVESICIPHKAGYS